MTGTAARPVLRAAAGLLWAILCFHAATPALVAGLWWSFDSGPWAQEPRLVLTERSTIGAIRVYGDHPDRGARTAAELTVDHLDATGGFDRGVLVVALPTGSGWVDPAQVLATEQWAAGDLATVSLRYSAAPSAAAYLLRRELAVDSARALLTEVTEHLAALPAADRPALVVHGQSLGALAGARVLEDRSLSRYVDAALWQGRPGIGRPSGSTTSHPDGPCTVSTVNPGDPVAALTWDLLGRPLEAVSVLADLPGSASARPGTLHSYAPVLPPPQCVTPGRPSPAPHER